MASWQDSIDHAIWASVSGFVGGFTWAALKLSQSKRMAPLKWIGGIALAGVVSWMACVLLLQSGMNSEYSAIVASIIGSSGERGLTYLLRTYAKGSERATDE